MNDYGHKKFQETWYGLVLDEKKNPVIERDPYKAFKLGGAVYNHYGKVEYQPINGELIPFLKDFERKFSSKDPLYRDPKFS